MEFELKGLNYAKDIVLQHMYNRTFYRMQSPATCQGILILILILTLKGLSYAENVVWQHMYKICTTVQMRQKNACRMLFTECKVEPFVSFVFSCACVPDSNDALFFCVGCHIYFACVRLSNDICFTCRVFHSVAKQSLCCRLVFYPTKILCR